jgi:hypothetical protein
LFGNNLQKEGFPTMEKSEFGVLVKQDESQLIYSVPPKFEFRRQSAGDYLLYLPKSGLLNYSGTNEIS